jgi:hypothetical protein
MFNYFTLVEISSYCQLTHITKIQMVVFTVQVTQLSKYQNKNTIIQCVVLIFHNTLVDITNVQVVVFTVFRQYSSSNIRIGFRAFRAHLKVPVLVWASRCDKFSSSNQDTAFCCLLKCYGIIKKISCSDNTVLARVKKRQR